MTFGNRLRKLREDNNIKQVELAKVFNITSQALSQYERDLRMPDATLLDKLATYFNVSVDFLLGRKFSTLSEEIDDETKKIVDAVFELDKEDRKSIIKIAELDKEDREAILKILNSLENKQK
ncbi:helix-turn-helix transcriptional regulator [Clostridioides difficile]|uniref:helix-turn-helix domain-containing protein n=1 Tax=Clostridioides difficile TaxID=1496 RepID=UPI001FAB38E1|nr:helix-turn-helix transcriptional regulator [Clostridioides difficile]MCJ0224514.1 helix-turn-helix transcriptional regulator [Clostridioides difficile]MCJ0429256.1 helix-turn-helix transcriptional regulator [Clostridioides difficile]MCJ0438455.1 helix-turn-helix transcriptional regulator [Clostridioides difficile]MCU6150003.1 helix-turn-helix transcriptional regulator [Clostridioides difficile]